MSTTTAFGTVWAELSNGFRGWYIPRDVTPLVWGDLAPHLQRAIDQSRGEFDLEDILLKISVAEAQLWMVEKDKEIYAAVVTEIIAYPRMKCLRIMLLGGKKLDLWAELWPLLEGFARNHECQEIEALTRPGVKKLAFYRGIEFKEPYAFLSYKVPPNVLQ